MEDDIQLLVDQLSSHTDVTELKCVCRRANIRSRDRAPTHVS